MSAGSVWFVCSCVCLMFDHPCPFNQTMQLPKVETRDFNRRTKGDLSITAERTETWAEKNWTLLLNLKNGPVYARAICN